MKPITCIEQDDFKMLEIGKVYSLERAVLYQGKWYAAVAEIPHYLFPQRRFKEILEDY